MISYGKQYIDQDDIDAVVEILKSEFLTQGPIIEEFEQDLCQILDARHCCAVANGTGALHLVGLALGWKPGDIIVTSPITFLSTANAVLYAGATPDFVDIDPVTYTLDPNKLEEKIRSHLKLGRKVTAVIGIDFAGCPADWEALRVIADQYQLQLVNDHCHALGASYNSDSGYAARYADAATLSFHPVKSITTGEGGAIATNNSEVAERVNLLRTHGYRKGSGSGPDHSPSWYYEMVELGYNYRITDFQSALGISQLRKLKGFIERRREVAGKYDAAFRGDDRFVVPVGGPNSAHAYHIYPLQIDFSQVNSDREKMFQRMESLGIRLQVHYIPIHLQPYYKNKFGFFEGEFPIAEAFYQRECSLPIYPGITDEEVDTVITNLFRTVSQ